MVHRLEPLISAWALVGIDQLHLRPSRAVAEHHLDRRYSAWIDEAHLALVEKAEHW